MKIKEFCIIKSAPIMEALKRIDEGQLGFVIVIDEGEKVCGTLSDGDIRRAFINGSNVTDILETACNNAFKYITINDTFITVVEIFKDPIIRFLPILDESGCLINLITRENMHVMLMEDIEYSPYYNFLSIDNSILQHEIHPRPWGYYKSTFLNAHSQSKILKINPNGVLSLQKHFKRSEYWIVISGNGEVTIDDKVFVASAGDFFYIPVNSIHRLKNSSSDMALMIAEVQLGTYFGEDDIVRFDDEYGRK